MLQKLGGRGRGGYRRNHQLRDCRPWSFLTTPAVRPVVLEGERGRGRPGGDAQLREDVLHVPGDGVLAEHERRGDLAVRPAGGDEPQHLELAATQAVRIVPVGPQQGVDAAKVRSRGETLEDRPRRLELQPRRVLVLERAGRRSPRAPAPGRPRTGRPAPARPATPDAASRARHPRRRPRARPSPARRPRSRPASRSETRRRSRPARDTRCEPPRDRRARPSTSAYAGSSRDRSRGGTVSASARRSAAPAARASPSASRSSARPGCGSRPQAFASR